MVDQSFDGRLGPIIDECMERLRNGESPSIEEFAHRYPDLKEQIHEVLPPLLMVEGAGVAVEESVAEKISTGSSTSQTRTTELAGKSFGDYEVIREIGRGGMGVVYEARQISLGRRVALKLLRISGFQDQHYVDRFLVEARAAGALQHPNIVPVFDVGQKDEHYFYAMQLIDGRSVDEVLRQIKNWNVAERKFAEKPTDRFAESTLLMKNVNEFMAAGIGETAIAGSTIRMEGSTTTRPNHRYWRNVASIGAKIADALQHSHSKGILHRDVKPSNLILDGKENVWITDFGLAKFEKENLTETGDIVGTLRYMAPERFEGWSDPRSDIYGLGATLFEMLTLRPLFDANDRNRLIKQVLHEEPTPLRKLDSRIPQALEIIVAKTLAKEPAERYRTAEELKLDLERFVEDRPIVARKPSVSQRISLWYRRNPLVASISIAFAVFALIAISILSLATIQLNDSLGRTKVAEQKERESRMRANRNLLDSYLEQSAALQANEKQGRHFESLNVLRKGVTLAANNEVEPGKLDRLMQLAISSFAQVDIERRPDWSVELEGAICSSFSNDAKSYAVMTQAGVVEVHWMDDPLGSIQFDDDWDAKSARENFQLKFSADDDYLAIRGMTGKGKVRLQIVRLSDQKRLCEVPTSGNAEQGALCFSKHGDRFSYLAEDGKTIRVVETFGGKLIFEFPLPDPESKLNLVDVCPRGCHFVLSEQSRIHMFQLDETGESERTETIETGSPILDIAWSPNGRFIAAACEDANAYIWEISNAETPWAICNGHLSEVQSVSFSRNGRMLLTRGKDLTTRIWDVHMGKILVRAETGTGISSNDQFVVDESDPQKLIRYRLSPINTCRVLFGTSAICNFIDLQFSPGSTALAARARNTDVHVWDTHHGQTMYMARIGPAARQANFHYKQQTSVTGFIKTVDKIGDPEIDRKLGTIPIRDLGPPANQTLNLNFLRHPNLCQVGSHFGMVGREHLLVSTDLPDWLPVKFEDGLIAKSKDLIATANFEEKFVRVWSVVEQQKVKDLSIEEEGAVPSLSPDGHYLMISTPGKFRLIRVSDWKTLKEFPHQLPDAYGYASFSADGKLIAICQATHVELHALDDLRHLVDLPVVRNSQLSSAYPAGASIARFGAENRFLAVSTLQNTIQLWDLERVREQLKELGLDAGF